jgi:hypothetical protein
MISREGFGNVEQASGHALEALRGRPIPDFNIEGIVKSVTEMKKLQQEQQKIDEEKRYHQDYLANSMAQTKLQQQSQLATQGLMLDEQGNVIPIPGMMPRQQVQALEGLKGTPGVGWFKTMFPAFQTQADKQNMAIRSAMVGQLPPDMQPAAGGGGPAAMPGAGAMGGLPALAASMFAQGGVPAGTVPAMNGTAASVNKGAGKSSFSVTPI